MRAKWKKNKNLKPIFILEKINTFASKTEKGVSYKNFDHYDAFPALLTMIDFPKSIADIEKDNIIHKSINLAVKRDCLLDTDSVLEIINDEIKILLSTPEKTYRILTSISLAPPYPINAIIINDVKVRLLKDRFPKKYIGREQQIELRIFGNENSLSEYCNVILSTKAQSELVATDRCLYSFDFLRGLWCLLTNTSRELIGGNPDKPINDIRLGLAHITHKENGNVASSIYWYEPNFVPADPYKIKEIEDFTKGFNWLNKQIIKSKYSKQLIESMVRYVRALDEKDHNVALVKIWNALEYLTSPNQANFSLVTRRCAYLYKDYNYHKQILEHLRENRNLNIHSAEQIRKAKTYCFQLQGYFRTLINSHLDWTDDFKSLEEANNFLDLPTNEKELERKKMHIEKAITFISS